MTIKIKSVGNDAVQESEYSREEYPETWSQYERPTPVQNYPVYHAEELTTTTRVKNVVKDEAAAIWELNTTSGKEGLKRGGVDKVRCMVRDELRTQFGERYTEFVEGTEVGQAIEQLVLWNLVSIGCMHFENKIPGAKLLSNIGREALTQTYQEEGNKLFAMIEDVVLKGIISMKENIPEYLMKEEEETVKTETSEE